MKLLRARQLVHEEPTLDQMYRISCEKQMILSEAWNHPRPRTIRLAAPQCILATFLSFPRFVNLVRNLSQQQQVDRTYLGIG